MTDQEPTTPKDMSSGEEEDDNLSEPGSPHPVRSYVSASGNVTLAVQEYEVGDLVYYDHDVYEVIEVKKSKDKETYICKIRMEGSSETKKVRQERLAECSIGKNNHKYEAS